MGGLTAVWAPPLVMYLSARQVHRDEFVRATGLLLFIGSVPLCAGYALTGHLTATLAGQSALMLIPTLAGFTLGERLRRGLSAQRFRMILLMVFLVLGLNLIRRAIWPV